jgi:hypothetical protein
MSNEFENKNRYNIVKYKDVFVIDGNNYIDEYNYKSSKSKNIIRYIDKEIFGISLTFKPI